LAQEKDVPADASVVVIAGPRTDLFQNETDMLQRFLKKGGHVLVLVDPPDEKAQATPVLDAFLKDWDFQADNDIVVDASGMGQLIGTDASVPVVATYPSHPITERFNVITAFPLARSITPILPASNGRAAVPIIQTSARRGPATRAAHPRTFSQLDAATAAGKTAHKTTPGGGGAASTGATPGLEWFNVGS